MKTTNEENKKILEIINQTKDNTIIIKVKPKSSRSGIKYNQETNNLDAYLHSIPENNKANLELIKIFKKQLKLKIEIISGFKSKQKKILIEK